MFVKFLIVFVTFVPEMFSTVDDQEDRTYETAAEIDIASPACDFTFKKLFKQPRFLISFLNSLLYPDAGEDGLKIRDIKYNDEALVSTRSGKDIFLDISCTCEAYAVQRTRSGCTPKKKFKFDVEMQRKWQPYYYERSVFYAARLLAQGVTSGTAYSDIIPVKVISFLMNSSTSSCDSFVYRVAPTISYKLPSGKIRYTEPPKPTMELFYLQLDKLPRDLPHDTSLNQWLSFINTEREEDMVDPDRYAFRIASNKFSDTIVNEAVQEMKQVLVKDLYEYKESVSAALKESMEAAEIEKEFAQEKAKTEAAKLKARKAASEAKKIRAKNAYLERRLQELESALPAKAKIG